MRAPWMPLYIADYLADTAHLTAAEHGAYLLLIMHYWRVGKLPTEDSQLARIARMNPREWAKSRDTIAAFFDADWRHGRIESEILKSDLKSKARSESGSRGGSAKSLKNKDQHVANATILLEQSSKQNDALAVASSSQSQSEKKEREESRFVSSTTRAAKGAGQALEAPPAFPPALPPVDRVLIAAGLLDKVLNPRAIEAARRTVERWEAAGWSVDLDIIPTVIEQSKRMAEEGDPPRSVAVFEKWIGAAHAKRIGAQKAGGDEEEAKLKAMTKPERIAHNHQRIARMRGHNPETERGLRTAMLEILRNEDFYGMTDRPEECDTVIPTAWLADHFADPRTLLQIEAAGIVRYDRLKAFCERAGLPDSLAEAREKHGAYLASLTGEEYLDVDEDAPPITGGHSQAA